LNTESIDVNAVLAIWNSGMSFGSTVCGNYLNNAGVFSALVLFGWAQTSKLSK